MNPDPKKPSRPSSPSRPSVEKAKKPEGQVAASKPANNESEPTAGSAHVPIWLILLFAILFYWGELYLDNQGGEFNPQVYEPYRSFAEVKLSNPVDDVGAVVARGEALYVNCAVCHQASGLGAPGQFPPLAGSDWVTNSNPARLIRIPLHGLNGPITVKGQEWNPPAGMTAVGGSFSNEDLAAILTFVRQAWGNKAPAVTPAQVAKVKEETSGRAMDGSAAWTAEELLKIPTP